MSSSIKVVDSHSHISQVEIQDVENLSDYNKGFVTQEKLFELVNWFEGPIFIDTKKRILPYGCYVKVNDIEYEKIEKIIYADGSIKSEGEMNTSRNKIKFWYYATLTSIIVGLTLLAS